MPVSTLRREFWMEGEYQQSHLSDRFIQCICCFQFVRQPDLSGTPASTIMPRDSSALWQAVRTTSCPWSTPTAWHGYAFEDMPERLLLPPDPKFRVEFLHQTLAYISHVPGPAFTVLHLTHPMSLVAIPRGIVHESFSRFQSN